MRFKSPGPSTAMMAMARKIPGNASRMSMNRMMRLSSHAAVIAAEHPQQGPSTRAISTATTWICRDMRAP